MSEKFCIVGAGGFGLMTALHLRETFKDASIKIFDINKDLSPTVNGGNGMLNYTMDFSFNELMKTINFNIFNIPNKFEFYIIHLFNYMFNNNCNRKLIKKLSTNEENDSECSDSNYYKKNYWDDIINRLIQNNIEIINNTEIIDYKYENNKIQIFSNKGDNYECDKLILCTAGNLKLIKKTCYHKFIDIFSGYSSIVEVKNVPKCFYYKDGIFITPYDNYIKITFKVEIGTINENYNIEPTNSKYKKLYDYIQNNSEIQKLGFISIKNIWRGSRAVSYDILPFIEQVDNNVYWMSGGGYMGTHMANNFGKWMVDYINNKKITNNNINIKFDPTLQRLKNIRKKYYIRLIILLLIIILYLFNSSFKFTNS